MNLAHIESRPSKRIIGAYEFLVTCERSSEDPNLVKATEELNKMASYVHMLSRSHDPNASTYHTCCLCFYMYTIVSALFHLQICPKYLI